MYIAIIILMLLDYILTYTGIHIFKCIEEANKLMVSFMQLDFTTGITIRLLQCSLVVLLYFILKNDRYKKYRVCINLILVGEIAVMIMHIGWLTRYFS